MREMLSGPLAFRGAACKHIWWGVSVEDRKPSGVPRTRTSFVGSPAFLAVPVRRTAAGRPRRDDRFGGNLHWVIVGGESGGGARGRWEGGMGLAINTRAWCEAAYRAPFFFKQWGGVRKKLKGRRLRGRTYDEMPKFRPNAMPSRSSRAAFAAAWDKHSDRWTRPSNKSPLVFLQPSLAV